MNRADALAARRARLLALVDFPVLLPAGLPRVRNFASNLYPYRAESHFLYFAGRPIEGAALVFRAGNAVLQRQNSAYLSAWLEGFRFLESQGITPSTQDSKGAFNNASVGVTVGLGYQIKGRMRLGVEHSFVGGPISASQVYLGSSF